MDNAAILERFQAGAEQLELQLRDGVAGECLRFQELLLKWNARVNLTSIIDPIESVEKHLLDSLAALRIVSGAGRLLDLGAGAGLPSIPLALARPELATVAVDSVLKKVGFMKQAIAFLGLEGRCAAIHARFGGAPALENIPRADWVISRALMDLPRWLRLAQPYVAAGGCAVAMLGRLPRRELVAAGEGAGAVLDEVFEFSLPFSGAMRSIARFRW